MKKVAGAITLVNARGLQLERVRVFYVPIQLHGSERMIYIEKERSRIRVVAEAFWVLGEWIDCRMRR